MFLFFLFFIIFSYLLFLGCVGENKLGTHNFPIISFYNVDVYYNGSTITGSCEYKDISYKKGFTKSLALMMVLNKIYGNLSYNEVCFVPLVKGEKIIKVCSDRTDLDKMLKKGVFYNNSLRIYEVK